eukprot:gnl/Chilomastix_cuspidata/1598.p2 GENE.gnl/Chilomastix_cuspidata/1598~~gnl/Chilomastix_cuspidata/1598.p2  ORF type:complete len:183 (-),score=68.07 gnl/Chilomastix_cuspidata/1598:8-556(-)
MQTKGFNLQGAQSTVRIHNWFEENALREDLERTKHFPIDTMVLHAMETDLKVDYTTTNRGYGIHAEPKLRPRGREKLEQMLRKQALETVDASKPPTAARDFREASTTSIFHPESVPPAEQFSTTTRASHMDTPLIREQAAAAEERRAAQRERDRERARAAPNFAKNTAFSTPVELTKDVLWK